MVQLTFSAPTTKITRVPTIGLQQQTKTQQLDNSQLTLDMLAVTIFTTHHWSHVVWLDNPQRKFFHLCLSKLIGAVQPSSLHKLVHTSTFTGKVVPVQMEHHGHTQRVLSLVIWLHVITTTVPHSTHLTPTSSRSTKTAMTWLFQMSKVGLTTCHTVPQMATVSGVLPSQWSMKAHGLLCNFLVTFQLVNTYSELSTFLTTRWENFHTSLLDLTTTIGKCSSTLPSLYSIGLDINNSKRITFPSSHTCWSTLQLGLRASWYLPRRFRIRYQQGWSSTLCWCLKQWWYQR